MGNKSQSFNLSIKLITAQFQKGLSTVQKQLKAFGNYLKGAFAVTGITSFIRQLTNVGGAFENQMARVRAIANTTDAEFKMLEKTAKNIGKNTRYSAIEAAQGLEILTRNGLSAAQAAETLTPALDLAAANAISLADAGDMVTNVVNMFGKSAINAAGVADLLSAAAANSATDVMSLYEAFKNAGPTAASLGLSAEEVTGALMTLANQGIKGADAGSKLAQAFSKLNVPKVQDKLKELGIEINSDTLKVDGLYDAIEKLSAANLKPEQLVELFGERAWRGINTLVKEIKSLDGNIELAGQAAGTSSRMAEQGIGSWELATKELRNTWQVSIQKMFDALRPLLVGFVNMTKNILQFISTLPGIISVAFAATAVGVTKSMNKINAAVTKTKKEYDALTLAQKTLKQAIDDNNATAFAQARIKLVQLSAEEKKAERTTRQFDAAIRLLGIAEDQMTAKGALTAKTTRDLNKTLGDLASKANKAAGALGKTSTAGVMFTKIGHGLKSVTKGILSFFGGWVGLAISAASVIGGVLANSIKKAKDRTVDYIKLQAEAAKSSGEQVAQIQSLKKILDDENESYAVKEVVLKKIKGIIPGYRAEIDKTTGKLKEGKKTIDEYCESLANEAYLQLLATKAAEKKMEVELAQKALSEALDNDKGPTFWEKLIALTTQTADNVEYAITAEDIHNDKLERKKQVLTKLQGEYDDYLDKMKEVQKANATTDDGNNGGGGGGGTEDDDRTKAAKKYQKAIENLTAVRNKSEADYKQALKEGKSEEEARMHETLSYEQYLKDVISATEQYIDTLSDLDDLKQEDIELISKLTAGLIGQRKALKQLQDEQEEAKEKAKEYASNLESLEKTVKQVNKSNTKYELKKEGRSKWDYFSTDIKEYKQLTVDLQRAQEDLAEAEAELSRFSEEEMELLSKRINELQKLRTEQGLTKEQEEELARSMAIMKKYQSLQQETERLISVTKDYENTLNSLQAKDALKNLKKEKFDTIYGGVKTLISGIEQLKNSIERISEGDADFFDYISMITGIIDTVLSLIETINTVKEIIEGIKLAQGIMTNAAVENAAKEIVAEEAKTAAIATAEATLAAEVAAAEAVKTAAVAAGCRARAALYQGEMAAAAAAANAIEGPILGPILTAAEIAEMETLIASAAAIPAFAKGGVLGGSSRTGDKLLFRGNSGEMILNTTQQKKLLDIANGKGNFGNVGQVEFTISGKNLRGVLKNSEQSAGKIRGNL